MDRTQAIALATTFIDNRAGNFLPPLQNQNNQFDHKKGQYVPTQLTKEEDLAIRNYERRLQERAKFCDEAMRKISSRTRPHTKPNASPPRPETHATWEDVLNEADHAREAWENKAKKAGGVFRRQLRSSGDYARLANPWIDLLPDGDYGSILCGGLKLIFGAAIADSNARNKINDCLQMLPDRIEEANQYLTLYEQFIRTDLKQNYRLKIASMNLSEHVLTAIDIIIKYFETRGIVRTVKAFFQQGQYAAKFEAVGVEINTKSEELRHLANECHEKVTICVLNEIRERPTREETASIVKNAVLELCNDSLATREWNTGMTNLANDNIDRTLIDRALDRSFNNGPGDSPVALNVIQQLKRNERFSMWLRSNKSSLILLNRNSDDSNSAFSYFASVLIASLRSYHESISVHYFCPVWEPDHPSPGSYHMLRSIILQLMWYTSNLELTPQDLPEPVTSPTQLQRLFFRCLEAIPAGKIVFVIIDGIARHAADDEAEVLQVVRLLYLASMSAVYHVKLKVLLTPPVTLEVVEALPEESVIMLATSAGEYSDVTVM
ncbi:MAG: hypothetical protein M1821_010060 [Bathelium mastoideum]|nr:MAG: hypothetical protein M1821_010060 [Bathelium mastoideum]